LNISEVTLDKAIVTIERQ